MEPIRVMPSWLVRLVLLPVRTVQRPMKWRCSQTSQELPPPMRMLRGCQLAWRIGVSRVIVRLRPMKFVAEKSWAFGAIRSWATAGADAPSKMTDASISRDSIEISQRMQA